MATNNEKVGILIKEFSNPVAVQTIYVKMLDGNVAAALFLSQLIYWSDRTKDKDGWVYKTYEDWYKEIGLTQYKISRAAKILKSNHIIATWRRRRGSDHQGPVAMHYKLSLENLTNSIMKFLDNGETLRLEDQETEQSEDQETSPLSTIEYSKDYNKDIAPKTGAGATPEPQPTPEKNTDTGNEKPGKKEPKVQPALGSDPLSFLPATLRPLGDAFLEEAGASYTPIKADYSLWRKTLNEWAARHFSPELVKLAVREMRKSKLTIGGPQSITKVANSLKGNMAKDDLRIYKSGDPL